MYEESVDAVRLLHLNEQTGQDASSSCALYEAAVTVSGVSHHMPAQLLLPVVLWTGIPLPDVALGVFVFLPVWLKTTHHFTLCCSLDVLHIY